MGKINIKHKFNIKKSFSDKNFKYGGYAALLTVIVIAIVVAANLVIDQLNNQFNLKLDLTKNKMYSLSDESYKQLDSLEKDVKIIGLYTKGKEEVNVTEILNKYKSRSKKVTLEYKDPLLAGNSLSKYSADGSTLEEGTLIIESGNKFKVISPTDFYNYTTDQQTGQQSVESLAIEQRVTAGIIYVTSTTTPTVYSLQGHSEVALPSELTTQLSNENYTSKDLNLITGEWKPAVNDILMIVSPKKDINNDELTKIKAFLSTGGRGIFVIDTIDDKMVNLKALLNSNGVDVNGAIVVEGNQNNYVQNQAYLVPNYGTHDILSPLVKAKLPIIFPIAHPITETKIKKTTQKVEVLLSTTTNSWAKINTKATTVQKEAGDLTGPFNVAVAMTDSMDSSDITKMSKVIVLTSAAFLDPTMLSGSNGGNTNFFMNSVNWLVDQKDSLTVRAKSLTSSVLTMTQSQILLLSGLVVIVIPLGVMIFGLVVWLRRRHL